MSEQSSTVNQVKSAKSYKKAGNAGLNKIDGSGAEFYHLVKEAVKQQQKEISQFNEIDEEQLRLVVQL